MLTNDDLQKIGKLLDKKIATDIAAIQSRTANIESNQVSSFRSLQITSLLRDIEKRVTAIEGRMINSVTKDDLQNLASKNDLKNFVTKQELETQFKKHLRGVVRQKDLKKLENKLINKLNYIIDKFDARLVDLEQANHHPISS